MDTFIDCRACLAKGPMCRGCLGAARLDLTESSWSASGVELAALAVLVQARLVPPLRLVSPMPLVEVG